MRRASAIKRAAVFSARSVLDSQSKTRARALAWGKKGHFYKPLPKEFRSDGFTYRRIAREGDVAIYEQTWNDCRDPSVCYEVIRIRHRESFQIDGRLIEAAEIYPRSEGWGVDSFIVTDKEAALRNLRELA